MPEELEKLAGIQQTLLNAIPDMIFRQRRDGLYLDFYAGSDGTLALPKDNVVGSTVEDLPLSDEKKSEILECLQRAIDHGTVEYVEYDMMFPIGKRIFEARIVKSGVDEAVSIVRDVTEHKEAERALSTSEANLSALIENTEDMVWSVDREYRILRTNASFSEKLIPIGLMDLVPGTKLIGNPILEATIPGDILDLWKGYYDRGLSGESFSEELLIDPERGIYNEFVFSPIQTEDGVVQGVAVFGRDITVYKEIERLKSEFISTMSHELRTPLTSVHGSLSLLLSGKFSGKPREELLRLAHRNSERLSILLDDLLDLEKLELNRLQFDVKPYHIVKLVRKAIQENTPYAQKCKVEFRLKEPYSPLWALADEYRLLQVLGNLLSNAVKFSSDSNVVDVRVERRGRKAQVVVEDYGEGIPEDFQPHVFEKFSRADASNTRKKGGSGLGLNIARQMIKRMGGTIGFVSHPGKGSLFYITLPRTEPSSEQESLL